MDLRLTDTNAASDSQGKTWGLEGNLFWWLVGGIGAGITLFFLFIVVCKASFMTAFGVAVVPVLLCLAYIFGLRQGKPSGYDRDCLEYWMSGAGFSPEEGGAKENELFVPKQIEVSPSTRVDPAANVITAEQAGPARNGSLIPGANNV